MASMERPRASTDVVALRTSRDLRGSRLCPPLAKSKKKTRTSLPLALSAQHTLLRRPQLSPDTAQLLLANRPCRPQREQVQIMLRSRHPLLSLVSPRRLVLRRFHPVRRAATKWQRDHPRQPTARCLPIRTHRFWRSQHSKLMLRATESGVSH